jgi:uncharacterized membrane protein SpoIIM required for sporulation/ABC-type transport system involved in multi-copper enzyme maturation permease subunit
MRHSLARALIITRREVQDQLRDWRIIAPIIVLTLFFPLLMNFTAGQVVAFVEERGADIIGERLIPFLLMIVGFFPISVSLVIALESFVGEKERHSLEPLLSSPLTDTQLYIGKTFAAMLPPLFASYLGITVYLVGLALTIQWRPALTLIAQIIALTTIQALVMVSGAVVISAQTTSVRAANLLASFIIVPMALLVQGESLIMFWGQYDVLWWIIFGLLLVCLTLVRMGVRLFNREELLGRDIDEINFRQSWQAFQAAFLGAGQGQGWRGWLRLEIPATLRRLLLPIGMMIGLLGAAIGLGYAYADIYRIPKEALDLSRITVGFGATLPKLLSWENVAGIFLINARALALASGLGAFSFGVLSSILLMAPLALSGYFAGQVSALGITPVTFFATFILPHGALEIPAAILEGAVILRLGASVIAPPPGKTLGEGWLAALADWAKISMALVGPLLIGAAMLEIFVTVPLVAQLLSSLGG